MDVSQGYAMNKNMLSQNKKVGMVACMMLFGIICASKMQASAAVEHARAGQYMGGDKTRHTCATQNNAIKNNGQCDACNNANQVCDGLVRSYIFNPAAQILSYVG